MKIKLTATGEIAEYDSIYAARLIEQGKAVKAEEENPTATRKTAAGKKR